MINLSHLDKLDLNRVYTFEEFEFINNELKTRTLVIDGKPVSLFELNENGKLIPLPQSTISMEIVVAEIARQLGNWNIQTCQKGKVTTSQGGFNFAESNDEDDDEDDEEVDVGGGNKKIRAPDVAFTPQETYSVLDEQQLWTFKGNPFTPEFVVEVGDIGNSTSNAKFKKADRRIKDEYLAPGTSVNLAWLIDPKNERIIIYRRGHNRKSYREWEDISERDSLPRFTLDISMIDYALSQESPEINNDDNEEGEDDNEDEEEGEDDNEDEEEGEDDEGEEGGEDDNDNLEIRCPLCEEEFDDHYNFMRHYEKVHVLEL